MEDSKIYNLLDCVLLRKWREEIEKTENETWFFTSVNETFEELAKELNEQEKKLLRSYSLAIEKKLDFIFYKLKIKILNYGIKIGIELKTAFIEFEQ